MQQDTSIPLSVRPAQFMSPADAISLQNLSRQNAMGDLQYQQALEDKQAQDALRGILSQPGMVDPRTGTLSLDAVNRAYSISPMLGQKVGQQRNVALKDVATLDETIAKTQKLRTESIKEQADIARRVDEAGIAAYEQALASKMPPQEALRIGQEARRAVIGQIQQSGLGQAIGLNPDQLGFNDNSTPETWKARALSYKDLLGHLTTVRGQDITMRGQDIGASTTMRGQDIGAATAARGQDITVRGQDAPHFDAERGVYVTPPQRPVPPTAPLPGAGMAPIPVPGAVQGAPGASPASFPRQTHSQAVEAARKALAMIEAEKATPGLTPEAIAGLDREANDLRRRFSIQDTPRPAPTAAPAATTAGPTAVPVPGLTPKLTEAQKKELSTIEAQEKTVQGALDAVKKTPTAFGMARGAATMSGSIPETIAGRFDSPAQREARSYVYNVVSKVINERAGAAQSAQELARLRSFLPAEMDSADQITSKLNAFQTYLKDQREGWAKPQGPGVAPSAPSNGWKIEKING